MALSVGVIVEVMRLLEEDLGGTEGIKERRNIIETGSYILYAYCASLRGWERVKMVLGSLRKQRSNRTLEGIYKLTWDFR
jgi:hypothetical protein